jgi:hypothetical protein
MGNRTRKNRHRARGGMLMEAHRLRLNVVPACTQFKNATAPSLTGDVDDDRDFAFDRVTQSRGRIIYMPVEKRAIPVYGYLRSARCADWQTPRLIVCPGGVVKTYPMNPVVIRKKSHQ